MKVPSVKLADHGRPHHVGKAVHMCMCMCMCTCMCMCMCMCARAWPYWTILDQWSMRAARPCATQRRCPVEPRSVSEAGQTEGQHTTKLSPKAARPAPAGGLASVLAGLLALHGVVVGDERGSGGHIDPGTDQDDEEGDRKLGGRFAVLARVACCTWQHCVAPPVQRIVLHWGRIAIVTTVRGSPRCTRRYAQHRRTSAAAHAPATPAENTASAQCAIPLRGWFFMPRPVYRICVSGV